MAAYIRDHVQIGRTIRDFRRQRNLTGMQLGEKVGLSQSKIAKIENGYYPKLRPDDIKKIMNILGFPQTIQQQIFAALELANPNTSGTRGRLHFVQFWHGNVYERERNTSLLRVFGFGLMPCLLQTISYRKAVLKHFALSQEVLAQCMNETVERQDLLWDTKHQFHFIFHETALFTAPAGREAQIVQLDRLERFIGIANIKIGIIPLEAGLLPIDNGAFAAYDNRLLVPIFANYETVTSDPGYIADHLQIFSALDNMSCYGEEARSLIRKAINHFS